MERIKEIDKAWFEIAKFFKKTGMRKSNRNNHGGYNYRSIDQVINAFSEQMINNKITMDVNTESFNVVSNIKNNAKANNEMTMIIVKVHIVLKSQVDGSVKDIYHHGCGNMASNNDRALQGAVSDGWKYAVVRSLCIPFKGIPDEADKGDNQEESNVQQEVVKKEYTLDAFEKSKDKIEARFKKSVSLDPLEITDEFIKKVRDAGFIISEEVAGEIASFCGQMAKIHNDSVD